MNADAAAAEARADEWRRRCRLVEVDLTNERQRRLDLLDRLDRLEFEANGLRSRLAGAETSLARRPIARLRRLIARARRDR